MYMKQIGENACCTRLFINIYSYMHENISLEEKNTCFIFFNSQARFYKHIYNPGCQKHFPKTPWPEESQQDIQIIPL